MFDNMEYRHTAVVRADAWFIRLYCWAWLTESRNVDFCKLFWGLIVFMPVNLLVRAVCFPFWLVWKGLVKVWWWGDALIDAAIKALPKRKPRPTKFPARTAGLWGEYLGLNKLQAAREKKAMLARKRRREARAERIAAVFTKVHVAADYTVRGAQRSWAVVKYFVLAVGVILAAAVLAVAVYFLLKLVGLIGVLAALIMANLGAIAGVLLIVVLSLVGFAVLMAIVAGVGAGSHHFLTETDAGHHFRSGVKDGALTFTGAIRKSFEGIKSHTCPRIEVVGQEEEGEAAYRRMPGQA